MACLHKFYLKYIASEEPPDRADGEGQAGIGALIKNGTSMRMAKAFEHGEGQGVGHL